MAQIVLAGSEHFPPKRPCISVNAEVQGLYSHHDDSDRIVMMLYFSVF